MPRLSSHVFPRPFRASDSHCFSACYWRTRRPKPLIMRLVLFEQVSWSTIKLEEEVTIGQHDSFLVHRAVAGQLTPHSGSWALLVSVYKLEPLALSCLLLFASQHSSPARYCGTSSCTGFFDTVRCTLSSNPSSNISPLRAFMVKRWIPEPKRRPPLRSFLLSNTRAHHQTRHQSYQTGQASTSARRCSSHLTSS